MSLSKMALKNNFGMDSGYVQESSPPLPKAPRLSSSSEYSAPFVIDLTADDDDYCSSYHSSGSKLSPGMSANPCQQQRTSNPPHPSMGAKPCLEQRISNPPLQGVGANPGQEQRTANPQNNSTQMKGESSKNKKKKEILLPVELIDLLNKIAPSVVTDPRITTTIEDITTPGSNPTQLVTMTTQTVLDAFTITDLTKDRSRDWWSLYKPSGDKKKTTKDKEENYARLKDTILSNETPAQSPKLENTSKSTDSRITTTIKDITSPGSNPTQLVTISAPIVLDAFTITDLTNDRSRDWWSLYKPSGNKNKTTKDKQENSACPKDTNETPAQSPKRENTSSSTASTSYFVSMDTTTNKKPLHIDSPEETDLNMNESIKKTEIESACPKDNSISNETSTIGIPKPESVPSPKRRKPSADCDNTSNSTASTSSIEIPSKRRKTCGKEKTIKTNSTESSREKIMLKISKLSPGNSGHSSNQYVSSIMRTQHEETTGRRITRSSKRNS